MKRFSQLLAVAAILAIVGNLAFAQSPTPNIATSAVCTHSGGGSGTYGPQNYNDGIIPTQGSLPWGWTSGSSTTGTNNWIMFEWPTPQTFGEVALYHAEINRRYLTGGTIQYWNAGTNAWVDHYTWLNPGPYTNWLTILQFPPATSTRMRITRWVMAPVGQTSNPNFREIEIRNICNDPPTDITMNVPSIVYQPADIQVQYTLERPFGDTTVSVTFNWLTPGGQLALSQSQSFNFVAPVTMGTITVPSTSLQPGFYNLEVVWLVRDECDALGEVVTNNVVMVLLPGQVACEVWPGDVNQDLIVNYGDKRGLNTYIHEANLRASWLQGPARYRVDSEQDPLTYIRWEAQPAVPWQTPEGCHMDTDGNGVVNNFDNIAVRTNWMKTHGVSKQINELQVAEFDISQNFPNPFNPSTSIRFSVPEVAHVSITILDVLGREVTTLKDGTVEAGVHTVQFDAKNLESGMYFAVANMQGVKSGLSYTETIRMTLSK
ncbi:MAG: hypothetical protein CL946_13040 [Ectothiorhodospiraceae bacterium]|nr:hypothetical protein [Ectothiorhodospiraceae bacterium]